MCLYPKLIINPKYKPSKKNNYRPPILVDERVKYIPIGCNKCMECRRKKAREWKIRLYEEIKTNRSCGFVTLTFSNESIAKIDKEIDEEIEGYNRDNAIATYAIRHYLERYRKENGKSAKHWFITELGHEGTENIHIHGLMWADKEQIEKHWGYGYTFVGEEISEKTINYISKYITKTDKDHKEYNNKILASSGIGSNYVNYRKINEKRDYYRTKQGYKIALPIYYRNKIFTEKEKENLWIEMIDKEERYVLGTKTSIKNMNDTEYTNLIKYARKLNEQLGYGTDLIDVKQKAYEHMRRKLMHETRIKNAKNKT